MKMIQRVATLEGRGPHSNIGDVLDLLVQQEAGEAVDWSAVKLDPALAASLDALPRYNSKRADEGKRA